MTTSPVLSAVALTCKKYTNLQELAAQLRSQKLIAPLPRQTLQEMKAETGVAWRVSGSGVKPRKLAVA